MKAPCAHHRGEIQTIRQRILGKAPAPEDAHSAGRILHLFTPYRLRSEDQIKFQLPRAIPVSAPPRRDPIDIALIYRVT
jgi:hypothetical protein